MLKKIFACGFFLMFSVSLFAQTDAGLLRDYVGVIRQSYHPDVVDYMNKLKVSAQKNDETDFERNIEAFLKGGFGSGFVYVDEEGNNYILTNYHVITRAYTISIEFEKQDGTKTVFSGLPILVADEDLDVALLGFPAGQRPFEKGLPFAAQHPTEGSDIYSAGFPGLGANPVWQFGRGIVSNVRVVIPSSEYDPVERGPWIQHTAQIDAGNSGGPLLMAVDGLDIPYAVAGINTASGINRQAANYAIPIERVKDFIDAFLAPKASGDDYKKLEEKVNAFVQGLSANRGVYAHIARYLSSEYVASQAEFAITEVEDQANYTIRRDIFSQSIFSAINYSVGWLLESELRELNGTGGVMRPSAGTISANSDGTWTVPLVFGDKSIDLTWINEYGVWRIKSTGADRAEKSQTARALRPRRNRKTTDYPWALSAGYIFLGLGAGNPRGSALDVSINAGSSFYWGTHLLVQSANFGVVELNFGYGKLIEFARIALKPYGQAGFGFSWQEKDSDDWRDSGGLLSKISPGLSLQAGVMVIPTAVPKLFFKTAYQFNHYTGDFFSFSSRTTPLPSPLHGIGINVGYRF